MDLAGHEVGDLLASVLLCDGGTQVFFGELHIEMLTRAQVGHDQRDVCRQSLQAISPCSQDLKNVWVFLMRHDART